MLVVTAISSAWRVGARTTSAEWQLSLFAERLVHDYEQPAVAALKLLVRVQQLDPVDRSVWRNVDDQLVAEPHAFDFTSLFAQADVGDVVVRVVGEFHALAFCLALEVSDDHRDHQPCVHLFDSIGFDLLRRVLPSPPRGIEWKFRRKPVRPKRAGKRSPPLTVAATSSSSAPRSAMRSRACRCKRIVIGYSEGIDGITQDVVAQFRQHGAAQHEIDRRAQDVFEMARGAGEVQ